MPNHYDSTILFIGPEDEIDRFCRDFEASKVKHINFERYCICQFVDPIPAFIYVSDSKYHYGEKRPLTDEEKVIREKYKDYPSEWWGVRYGCYESNFKRMDENRAIFTFWTPYSPIETRIFVLLHNKYPALTIYFEGEDECNPEYSSREIILYDFPIIPVEKLNEVH